MDKYAPVEPHEIQLIIMARRGGLSWYDIVKMFPRFKKWHHMRYQLIKMWPQGLPPRGVFTRLESLIHLYKQDRLNDKHLYLILGEQKAMDSYNKRVKKCKQWYGMDFIPALHHCSYSFLENLSDGKENY